MLNLRLMYVDIVDSSTISAAFSDNLINTIDLTNLSIVSNTINVTDPQLLKATVIDNKIEITTTNLVDFSNYTLICKSTNLSLFKSVNSDKILLEDEVANQKSFTVPSFSASQIQSSLNQFLYPMGYDTSTGLIKTYIDSLSSVLLRAKSDIKGAANSQYLSFQVTDEQVTRGESYSDRLLEESAYELLRVSRQKTGTANSKILSFDNFPSYLVSLNSKSCSETPDLTKFDRNTFTFNLSNKNIIKLDSLTFTLSSGSYVYNIEKYGYHLLTKGYDDYSFIYYELSSNQIKINDIINFDSSFNINDILSISISYTIKDLSIRVDSATLVVYSIKEQVREATPSIVNVFSLSKANIKDSAGNDINKIGGVLFIDPNQINDALHPAFKTEVPFSFENPPSLPGEYSVDYSTSTVYVYGATINDGTGSYPPVATYYYKFVYNEDIDYSLYNFDVVAMENGTLLDEKSNISFSYESTLSQGIDFVANLHKESLNERIENRLLNLGKLSVKNGPITDVFRIYNETSGEVYRFNRFFESYVYFDYTIPPSIKTLNNEICNFELISNELLIINSTISTTISTKIVKILLANNLISNASEDGIGYIKNTSLTLDGYYFTQEKFFDSTATQSANLSYLTSVGDYSVDYSNGIIYVNLPISLLSNIGYATYKHGSIKSQNKHIISVDGIYTQVNIGSEKTKKYDYSSFSDDLINLKTLSDSAEKYVLLSNVIGYYDQYAVFSNETYRSIYYLRGIFEQEDLKNNKTPVDFSSFASFSDKTITLNSVVVNDYGNLQSDIDGYFFETSTPIYYQSANITRTISVIRNSDGYQLHQSLDTVVLGSETKFYVTQHTPMVNDYCTVKITYTINNLSEVFVDYNSGNLYLDYSYLEDEILVSYEYGDNCLDFSGYNSLSTGDKYYVSYRVGALRRGLFDNFGSIINIPVMNNFDTYFDRETYRDFLIGIYKTFTNSTTKISIENLIQQVTKIKPEVLESVFKNWSLGYTKLKSNGITSSGGFSFSQTDRGSAALINSNKQTINISASNHLKLEEGSFGCWISLETPGLDSNAEVEIYLYGDVVQSILTIFVGVDEAHPIYLSKDGKNYILLNKNNINQGLPSMVNPGTYIYYTDKWYIQTVSIASVVPTSSLFDITVKTNNELANINSTTDSFTSIRSANKYLNFSFDPNKNTANMIVSFIADNDHYLLDAGNKESERISIYKDVSGYLNFRVIDKNKNVHMLSSDISSWKKNELHHVGAAWKISSLLKRDELHLFVDGQEVPNIIRYGSNAQYPYPNSTTYSGQKYRTNNSQYCTDVIQGIYLTNTSLVVTAGSNIVTGYDFIGLGVTVGDYLIILDSGYDVYYNIIAADNVSMTLDKPMPLSATVAFSLYYHSEFSLINSSIELDLYSKFSVKKMSPSKFTQLTTDGTNITLDIYSGNIESGDLAFVIDNSSIYEIKSVNGNQITILNMGVDLGVGTWNVIIYRPSMAIELRGLSAIDPQYSITRIPVNDLQSIRYSITTINLKNTIYEPALFYIDTYGLTYKNTKSNIYNWSSTNIVKTILETPINIERVQIKKYIVEPILIKLSNSVWDGGSSMWKTTLTFNQPSQIYNGKFIDFTYYSPNSNINYAFIATIGNVNDTLNFPPMQTQITYNQHLNITSINVYSNVFDTAKDFGYVYAKESASITNVDGYTLGQDGYAASIRYSYQIKYGNTLQTFSTNTVTDANQLFVQSDVGNYLKIYPGSYLDGYAYKILSVSSDNKSITLGQIIPATLINVEYEIVNVTTAKTGFQNGMLWLEQKSIDGYDKPGKPFLLDKATYEVSYPSYLKIPFESSPDKIFIGTDIENKNNFNGALREVFFKDQMLTDVRPGETTPIDNFTAIYNRVSNIKKNKNTTFLSTMDAYPFADHSDYYESFSSNLKYFQSTNSVSSEFDKAAIIINEPIVYSNAGIISNKSGTIEFWVNPLYDSDNDPNVRYYFSANSIINESITTSDLNQFSLSSKASKIVSIQNAHSKINYNTACTINSDKKTITLSNPLPARKLDLIVHYVPYGVNGDSISIYKSIDGMINFTIMATGTEYTVSAYSFWKAGTWHKIKAMYSINGGKSRDTVRLFVDGFEKTSPTYGSLYFSTILSFGLTEDGKVSGILGNISLKDQISSIFIGGNGYSSNAYAVFDNLRISNQMRPTYTVFGASLDPSYSSLNQHPVKEDLYTTLLLDFDKQKTKNNDFASLASPGFGSNDFYINIYDSFNKVSDNNIRSVMNSVIDNLKPAVSRAFVSYK